jgi:hypothetical protein
MKSLIKADDEYRRLLKVMERDPKFDSEEIVMFEKTELIRKSIEVVQRSASKQKEYRKSLEELKFVESRVQKNLGIQEQLSPVGSGRRGKKKPNADLYMKKVEAKKKKKNDISKVNKSKVEPMKAPEPKPKP